MTSNTIFILEDDVDLRDHYQIVLEHEGYNILGLYNSDNILKLIDEHSPLLIISDLVMPEHSGGEGIIKITETTKVPIIAISAYKNMLKSVKFLVDASLLKPVSDKQLVDTVRNVLH